MGVNQITALSKNDNKLLAVVSDRVVK